MEPKDNIANSKLISALYRFMDLLEAVEAHMADKDSNLSLECILCCNQARQAVASLEAMTGTDVKQFLRMCAQKNVAPRNAMQ